MSHSPAPWFHGEPFIPKHVEGRTFIGIGNGADHLGYVAVGGWIPKGEVLANARVMAAAPDLLEASKQMLAHLVEFDWEKDSHGVPYPEVQKLREAIAKAEGTL